MQAIDSPQIYEKQRGPRKIRDFVGNSAQGAENLGWELDKLLEETLEAMKAIEE